MNELRVKQIINQRNISVRQFSEMLGITREHCYHILKGENISKKQLENMSRVLNLPIRDLYRTPEEIASEYDPYTIEYGRTEHYKASDIVTFSKLSGKYGAFSNMSTAYLLICSGIIVPPLNIFLSPCVFRGIPIFRKRYWSMIMQCGARKYLWAAASIRRTIIPIGMIITLMLKL